MFLEKIEALKVIKSEMDSTLKSAQESLKFFSDYPEDQEALDICLKSCGQIRGIFSWLNFSAGLQLMAEIAQLGKNLLGFSLQCEAHPNNFHENQFNELIILLSETLLILGRYLEYSLATQKFLPVLLIPAINKLRRINEQPLLEESAFFQSKDFIQSPLSSSLHSTSMEASERLVQSAKSLRQRYQVSLLAIMKGENIPEQLARLHQIVSKIYEWSATTAIASLWWVALAAIEAMQTEQVELTQARLSLFQKLDKPLKNLAYEGDHVLTLPPASALIKACIYIASLADNHEAPVLTQVRQAYGLENSLLDSELRLERALMEGPENATLNSVMDELQRELDDIKIQVENYKRESKSNFYSVASALEKMARTLIMIGLVGPGQLLQNQAIQLADAQIDLELSHLMVRLTDNLLSVEQTIIAFKKRIVDCSILESRDFCIVQARCAAITESRINLSLIRCHIESWMTTGEALSFCELLPVLSTTCGALYFLQLVRAGHVLYEVSQFFETKCLEHAVDFPDEQEFSLLADALMGIEYYLEMIEKNQWIDEGVLDKAESSILALSQEVVAV